MLNINTIDHLNLNVTNLEESINFYQKIFGFEVKELGLSAMSGKEYAIIGLTNKVMLAIYQTNTPIKHSNFNHFGVNIENFDEAVESIRQDGSIKINAYGNEDGVVRYPNSKSMYIEDPNGYEIELSSKFGGGL